MLQVDIVKFFDRIPRDRVKTLVNRRVGSKLIAEIICQAIDCELERSSGQNHRLPELSGILIGVGLRQGMPLSPMLSNLLLQKFDQDVGRQGISALRYADDIAVFCDSKADCLRALELMQEALKRVDLQIPDLEDNGKTQLIEPSATAAFLGVEIKRIEDGYKLCPPFRRIADIQADMEQVVRLESCVANGRNVGKVLRLLDSLIIGHGASMIVLDDPGAFLKRLDAAKAKSMNGLLVDLLGKNVVDKLDDSRLAVLGLKPFPSPTRRYRPRRKAHPN